MELYHPETMESFKETTNSKTFYRCVDAFEKSSQDDVTTSSKECDVNKKTRGRKPIITKNTVRPFMCQYSQLKDLPVDVLYVIEGVARLDWYSRGDALRKNVVAPNPVINHSCVHPWKRVLKECDGIKVVKEEFTQRKPNDYGEWFLSPAGKTRREYLINLNKVDDNVTALSVNSIVRILREVPEISSKELQSVLRVGKRQAERYNKACKIMMPFLERAFLNYYEFRVEILRKKIKKAYAKDELTLTHEDEEYILQGIFDSYAVDSVGGGLSENYHEDICGVYVPFEGVKLENFNTCTTQSFDDFGVDDYLLAGDV